MSGPIFARPKQHSSTIEEYQNLFFDVLRIVLYEIGYG